MVQPTLEPTQHIEDDYQRGMITGAAFVDISAAYDTVYHRLLIQKLYDFTGVHYVKSYNICCQVEDSMLS